MSKLLIEDSPEYEDNLKYEDIIKYEDDLKFEDKLKYEQAEAELKCSAWTCLDFVS